MFCVNCGKEILDGAGFCPYCGASQQQAEQTPPQQNYQTPPQQGYQAPPQQGPQAAPSGGVPYEMILKIFSLICAAIFLIRALATGFGSLRTLFSIFQFFYFPNIISALIMAISALGGLWMTLVLVLMGLRRTKENTGALFFGAAAGGVLILICHVLRIFFGLIFAHYFFTGLLPYMLGVIVAVGGLYGILYLMGEAPAPADLMKDPAGSFSVIFASASGGLKDVQAKQAASAAARNEAAQAAAAQAAANAANNGYGAPNGGYGAPNGAYGAPNNGYGAPNGAYGAPNNGYGPQTVKTDRSLIMYIVLSIITCGIYSWYFIYSLARDVNIMCRADGKKTGGLLAFILLSIITCGIYSLYWMYSIGNRLAANAPRYGMNFQENGTTVLLWYLVGALLCGIGPYVAMHFLIKNSNALGVAYNRSIGF